jgi:hypothetical protein
VLVSPNRSTVFNTLRYALVLTCDFRLGSPFCILGLRAPKFGIVSYCAHLRPQRPHDRADKTTEMGPLLLRI